MAPPANDEGYQLWEYYPSMVGNIVVASVFGLLALTHFGLVIFRKQWFCIPLVVGGLYTDPQTVEVIGYGARAYARSHTTDTLPYAIQSLLILLAPILFAASVYMYLGRVIHSVDGQRHCLIPLKFLTKVFVAGDVACFLAQGAGGGLLSSAKKASKINLGQNIILAGLILQIVIFFGFLVVAINFHIRMRGRSTASPRGWQRKLLGLYVVSVLIAVRNIFRAIEYGMGSPNYLLSHEWCTFVFDAALMIFVMIISLSWYPGVLGKAKTRLSGHELENQLASGEVTREVLGPKTSTSG
ncbi:RTA1-domain-containing protein [Aureobasidium pullulans]|uniref:RTA1-domain-containing protein n=1 Tax=Aureobasidium pullulans TaxID=5580 RepID=A0AB38LXC2_AURPU|nr:RTA1-domain-containing protein [Aureobasidium pullulans]